MAEIIRDFIYEPSSVYITGLSAVTLLFLAYLGISEIMGNHLKYSKFWNVNLPSSSGQFKVSSKIGMVLLYSPAAIVGISSFFMFPDGGIRFFLLKIGVSVHFSKRVLESLFLHKYSGAMMLDSVILISGSYFFAAAGMIFLQSMTNEAKEPSIDLKYAGVVLFLVGISGNFYHHYLLSKLRKNDEKGYKIPKGGLFNLIICPHYLFEILGLLGISLISQTSFSYSVAIGSALYLMGRSYVTKQWYQSKFEDFPKNVKALIPFVF